MLAQRIVCYPVVLLGAALTAIGGVLIRFGAWGLGHDVRELEP